MAENTKFGRTWTVQDLINALSKSPDKNATVILPAYNGKVVTYCAADHLWSDQYEAISNDFFGTPGRMDRRLFNKDIATFCYIGSVFSEIPNPKVDIGSDNTNTCIEEINGPDGDSDMLWKSNDFEYNNEKAYWKYESKSEDFKDKDDIYYFKIIYFKKTKLLVIHTSMKNPKLDSYHYSGYCYGIEDFLNAVKVCHISKQFTI